MTDLKNYLQDGANYQARAVLMILQRMSNIEESWDDTYKKYDAEIKVARWENCREQGYVISLKDKNYKQLNIAFFEHRNSDSIHALKWVQSSINSLTIENAEFGDLYKDKYDTSYSVGYGEFDKMANWIIQQLTEHWVKYKNKI